MAPIRVPKRALIACETAAPVPGCEMLIIAAKPACLGHVEAASVPIGALTAWQGLFDRAGQREGERVFHRRAESPAVAEIANLLDGAELKPFVGRVLPLEQASAAYFGAAEPRNPCGKLVIAVVE
ncbi:MAG TPA: hypothetical protein VFO90_08980 [Terrimicrobiaceae bacterium]|nr:hypothetical protein [Terrimicrobiaceae bacterium]